MNLKKLKRVLAVSLAVMLAVPPNVYGGPAEVKAEEIQESEEAPAEKKVEELEAPEEEPQPEIKVEILDEERNAVEAAASVTFHDSEWYLFTGSTVSNQITDPVSIENIDNVTYKSSNENIATVSGSGRHCEVTAVAPGQATIAAIYEDAQVGSFPVTVEDPSDKYTVSASDWTNEDVRITAADGYVISKDGDDVANPTYEPDITIEIPDDSWETENFYFYLKKAGLSGGVICQSIYYQIDKVAPTGKIYVGDQSWSQVVDDTDEKGQVVTGIVDPEFYISAQDDGAGIQSVAYHVFENYISKDSAAIEKAVEEAGGWKVYDDSSIALDHEKRNVVYVKLTDKAGNITYLSSACIQGPDYVSEADRTTIVEVKDDFGGKAEGSKWLKGTPAFCITDREYGNLPGLIFAKTKIDTNWKPYTITGWDVDTSNPSRYVFTPQVEGMTWAEDVHPEITINLVSAPNDLFDSQKVKQLFVGTDGVCDEYVDVLYANDIHWADNEVQFVSSDDSIAQGIVKIEDETEKFCINCTKEGSVTIKATYHGETIGSFRLHVSDPYNCFTVSNENWTSSKVVITAKKGFYLCKWNGEDEEDYETKKTSQIILDTNAGTSSLGNISFVVMDDSENFAVSEPVTVDYKIDKEAPYGSIYTESYSWNKVSGMSGREIQLGVGSKVYIEAMDNASGIANVQYHIFDNYVSKDTAAIEKAVAQDGGWKKYTDGISPYAGKYCVIYAKLTDGAGNVNYFSTEKVCNFVNNYLKVSAVLRGVTSSSAKIQVDSEYDDEIQRYYLMLTTSQETVDVARVMSQGKRSTTGIFDLTGLKASTTYYAYAAARSYDDDLSNVVVVKFTTAQADTAKNIAVSAIKAQTYTGNAIKPKVTVKDASTGKKLTQGKQYTISYENNVNAGIATVVITGVKESGYEGVKRAYFTINAQNVSKKIKAKIIGKKFLYTGYQVTPPVSVVYNKKTLVEGKDYDVIYGKNVSKGNATAVIYGKGNYTGMKEIKFKITGPKMKDADVSLTADSMVYSSSNSFPGVIVEYNGKTCTEGVDYVVKYPKKLKAGKNVITITGKGNLSGSVKRNFMVTKAPMSEVEVTLEKSYDLTGKSLKVLPTSVKRNGNELTKKDYTIKYRLIQTGKTSSSIKTAGSYQMILTGKGSYQGTKTADFAVMWKY